MPYVIENIYIYTNRKTGLPGEMVTYFHEIIGGLIPVLGDEKYAKRFSGKRGAERAIKTLGKGYRVKKV
jgi:hypothetical protein